MINKNNSYTTEGKDTCKVGGTQLSQLKGDKWYWRNEAGQMNRQYQYGEPGTWTRSSKHVLHYIPHSKRLIYILSHFFSGKLLKECILDFE